VGDPGNACDTQPQGCFGAVSYEYRISKYETTNAQYAEFLNAVADTDAYGLYNPQMDSPGSGYHGGITRSGTPGSYTYSAITGREYMPVTSFLIRCQGGSLTDRASRATLSVCSGSSTAMIPSRVSAIMH
jgi:hypothetical protein